MMVRHYRAEDWTQTVRLVLAMVEESPTYRSTQVDIDKLQLLAHHALEHRDWLVAVAEEGERVVGFLALFVEESYFSREKMCGDLAFYVEKEWRGSTAAPRLLRFGEGWALGRGARHVQLGITTQINTDKAGSFYAKCGYLPIGVMYKKRLLGVVLPPRL